MANEIMNVLQDAIKDESHVTFDYFSVTGEKTSRNVVPVEFFSMATDPLLVAIDSDKKDYRRFYVSNMENVKVL